MALQCVMWRQRLRYIAATVILLNGCNANAGRAAIFGPDDRVYVTAVPGSPFSPIGVVQKGAITGRYGTGTLVGTCDVLTSQHIFSTGASPIGGRVKFTAGIGTREEASSRGTVIVAGGREKYPLPNQEYQAVAHDWMLVRLDRCLGAIFGHANLRTWARGEDDFSHVQSLGYPMDRDRVQGATLDPSCKIRGIYTLVWFNDCATMQGSSGGPLFRLSPSEESPRMEIFAIQTAGFGKGINASFWLGNANQATPVSMILPYIQRYLSRR